MDSEIKRNQKNTFLTGFTVIEMIVIVSVVATIFLIAVSNFSNTKAQFSLSRATYAFGQNVSRAQNLASGAVNYMDSSGVPHSVDGYGVYVDLTSLGNKKYLVYADKTPGNQQYDAGDYIVDTIDFSTSEPGIMIKQINNVVGSKISINFTSSNLATTLTQLSSGQTASVVFSLVSNTATTKMININSSGLVEAK